MDVTSILERLNPAQQEAVVSDRKHLLVLAGAGSGKTRVLVHRITWKVQVENIAPHSILAVTFTNKASREMRERIDKLLGFSLKGMWVGTFHGLAHRLLKLHWRDAELVENFQILDSDDQLRIIKRITRSLNLDEQRWPPRQAQWWINAQKDEGVRAAHIQPTDDPFIKTMLNIYFEYELTCKRSGVIDFAELLLRSLELWRQNSTLLSHYQQRFKHILVDEFQDTNAVQYAWLRLIAGNVGEVTAVGDDDQSIYGWRGAKVENIRNFQLDFEGTHLVRLEQNYRSTSNILRAANAVIQRNSGRLGKKLWTEAGDGEAVALYAAHNEHDEAQYVTERIKKWLSEGNRRDEVAILYRSNRISRVLEGALLQANIPFRVYGGQRFYERMEIKNALAYLRLMVDRHYDSAYERVVNFPPRGIGDRTLESIRQEARKQDLSLWSASLAMISDGSLSGRACNAVGGFAKLIDSMSEGLNGATLAHLAEVAVHNSGLKDFYRRDKGEVGLSRVENLEELVSACMNFDPDEEERSALLQFLDQVSLDAGDRRGIEGEDSVQLMTLHSAKGLEFPLVFMVALEENIFPSKMALDEPGRLEEERRLAYVGITRAKTKLYVSFAENRTMYGVGSGSYNPISRFIRDIPADVIEEVRLRGAIAGPTSVGFRGLRSDEGDGTGFHLGQQVSHQVYGEGVILNFEGNGPRARVHVKFEEVGMKILILSSARLSPV